MFSFKPLEIRESLPEKARKAELLGLDCPQAEKVRGLALALESGRFVYSYQIHRPFLIDCF